MNIEPGIMVANARAILPSLRVFEEQPESIDKLLNKLAEWCIRYSRLTYVLILFHSCYSAFKHLQIPPSGIAIIKFYS
jgi:hypothetical protein